MKKFILSLFVLTVSAFVYEAKAQMTIQQLTYEKACYEDNGDDCMMYGGDGSFYAMVTIEYPDLATYVSAIDYFELTHAASEFMFTTDPPQTGFNEFVHETISSDVIVFRIPFDMSNESCVYNDTVLEGVQLSFYAFGINLQDVGTADLEVAVKPEIPYADVPPLCTGDAEFDLHTLIDDPAHWGGVFELYCVECPTPANAISGSYLNPGVLNYFDSYDIDYIYTTSDGNCTFYYEYLFYVGEINQSPDLSYTLTQEATCGEPDGEVTLDATGGNPPYSYGWNDGVLTQNRDDLFAGIYSAFVEDANGCKTETEVAVSNEGLTATLVVDKPNCWDDKGDIDLTVSSASNYTVYWNFGSFEEDHTNLNPGIYIAEIKNDDACITYAVADLRANSKKMEITDLYVSDTECGMNYGSIDIYDVSGGDGSGTFTYEWYDGMGVQIPDQEDYYIFDLAMGNYSVKITDLNGCSITDTFYVGQYNPNWNYDIWVDEIKPSGCSNNGEVVLYFDDYTGDGIDIHFVEYEWNTGSSSLHLTNVGPGKYTFEYRDSDGCEGKLVAKVPALKPALNPICLITVDTATTTNLIVWEREETTNISGYNVYREEGVGTFNKIGFLPYTAETVFNDVTASPQVKSWSYKISAVNSCGIEGPLSAAHRTSHIKKREINGTDITIYWNLYRGFDYSATGIDVWRYTDTQGEWMIAGNVGSTVTSFLDAGYADAEGLDYMLSYEPPYTCTATKAQNHNSSRSNRIEGAFSPGDGTGDTNNGLEDLNLESNVQIYPNPTTGDIFIALSGFENHVVDYKLLDLQGKVISSGEVRNNLEQIHLSGLGSGVYMIQLSTDYHVVTKRVVKQ